MTSWLDKLRSRWSVLIRSSGHKRVSRMQPWQPEELELRTLLSARGPLDSPLAAQISQHHGKASFTPPDVGGVWTLSTSNGGGSVSIFPEEAIIHYSFHPDELTNIPEFSSTAKFKAKHPNEVVDSVKAQTNVGPQKVKLVITFAPNEAEPQTFTGQVTIRKTTIQFTGSRIV